MCVSCVLYEWLVLYIGFIANPVVTHFSNVTWLIFLLTKKIK